MENIEYPYTENNGDISGLSRFLGIKYYTNSDVLNKVFSYGLCKLFLYHFLRFYRTTKNIKSEAYTPSVKKEYYVMELFDKGEELEKSMVDYALGTGDPVFRISKVDNFENLDNLFNCITFVVVGEFLDIGYLPYESAEKEYNNGR